MSGAGRVCAVHGEWCPTGECRWCAPAEEARGSINGLLLPALGEPRDPPPGTRVFGAGPVERLLPKLLDGMRVQAPTEVQPHVCMAGVDAAKVAEFFERHGGGSREEFLVERPGVLVEKFRTGVGNVWVEGRPEPMAAPVPVKAPPVVGCFCGEWHFEGPAVPLARDPAGAIHTPDACGRSSLAMLPHQAVVALVPCACGVYDFNPADFAPGRAMRMREANGDFHAPEACLDQRGHALHPRHRSNP